MTITELCAGQGFSVSRTQQKQFDVYTDFLLAENEKYNLTAVRERDGVISRHLFDSLAPLFLKEMGEEPATVVDVGTGGGLPGIPLAIAAPQHRYTLIDSTEKKCAFLRALLAQIELPVEVTWGRAEELGRGEYRERFDLAVSRAVAAMPALCELVLPMLRVGGRFIAYKGEKGREELEAARLAVGVLGGRIEKILDAPTGDGSPACLIIIEKERHTPKTYPRKWSQIKKKPL